MSIFLFKTNLFKQTEVLIGQKIENIAGAACFVFSVKFGVTAPGAWNHRKSTILNIEITGKPSTGCSDFIHFCFLVSAFCAGIFLFLHGF